MSITKAIIGAKLKQFQFYILGALLVAAFGAGMYLQHKIDDGALQRKNVELAEQQGKLDAAAMSLRGAASALRAQKLANEAALKAERESKKAADEATEVEKEKVRSVRHEWALYVHRMEEAKKKPDCKTLLDTDVLKVCGL
jgi:peptidoglycan hydrolase CwlO-like protein